MFRIVGFIVGCGASAGLLLLLMGTPNFHLGDEQADPSRYDRAIDKLKEKRWLESADAPAESGAQAPSPANAAEQVPDREPADDLADEVAPATVAADPATKAEQSAAASQAQPPVVIPDAAPSQPLEPEWHAFWNPFRSEVAATGFVRRLENVTGLDYRIAKVKAGGVRSRVFVPERRRAHRKPRANLRRHRARSLGYIAVRCFLTGLLLGLLGGGAVASTQLPANANPEHDWANYMAHRTNAAPGFTFPHARCFRMAAIAHGVPETLLLAVARGESDFEATARSRANAHGIMQIQWPETARHLGLYRLSELYDPCTNIDAGTRYLKELMTRYDNDLHLTLAAYNYGPGRIPPGATSIPNGARWYSAYIYRHLDYVLREGGKPGATSPSLYSDVGSTVLVSFGEPYRAAAFVARFERQAPELHLDWFRKATGRFDVELRYADQAEFSAAARKLTLAGFPLH